jgi:putative hemolysin
MDTGLLPQLSTSLIFFVIALSTRGIFAFLETSITALRLFKLKELARSIGKYDLLFQTLEKNPHRVLITTLIASSVADVTTAALATHIGETIFAHFNLSSGLGFSAGIGLGSIAIILFGEIIPKNLARARGERIFKSMLWLINMLFYVLYPLVTVLTRFSDSIIYRIQGSKTTDPVGDWVASEREIKFLIDYIHGKGLMEPEKTEMLSNIFELGRTPVKEIMVPSTDIVSVDVNISIQDALQVFSKHQFTRMPVYQDRPDNIIGMAHQKDIFLLLSKGQEKPLKEILRPILFIPESVKVNQLLREFRQQHMHIAIVLNEHGSVTGLITLEDVLEEIVGDISDEHEPTTEKIITLSQGGWLVDASITLEELEEFLNIEFETEDSVTLAGFLTERLQHLPKKGERVLYKDYYFQVQKASTKRVRQVLIFEEKNKETIS